jgi:2-C-methyl-D-erythritol 4-phosphate cytidylyltransferase
MAVDRPKQFLRLGSRTLLEHSIAALMSDPRVARVLVVVAPGTRALPGVNLPGGASWAAVGGASRAHSVLNGLRALSGEAGPEDRVLVHDAARPCLAASDLGNLIDAAGPLECGGLLAAPLSDTLKRVDHGHVAGTAPRAGLWRAQTPQLFPLGILLRALEAIADLNTVTDESSAVEGLGLHPLVVEGQAANLKVTTPADWPLAEAVLRAQGRW